MKILFVTPKGMGGIFSQTAMLASHINASDARANLFLSTIGKGFVTFLSLLKMPIFAFSLFWGKPDILVLELASKGSTYRKIAYAKVSKILGTPYIIHLHGGGYANFYASSSKFMRRRITDLFQEASGIVLLHEGQIPMMNEIVGELSNRRVAVIPNGVQVSRSISYKKPLPGEPIRFAFLGNVSEEKGIPELLKALSLYTPRDIFLTLVGQITLDKQHTKFLKLCETKGLATAVGIKSKAEALEILSRSHILVLPSKIENFPNVILEAFSLGVPVMATAVGGIPALVRDGETGWLVPVNRPLESAIAEAIDTALRSRETFEDLSKRAYESALISYDIDVVAGIFLGFCSVAIEPGSD
jgi:glycosyltransferase involved in cell wall biosynthesis